MSKSESEPVKVDKKENEEKEKLKKEVEFLNSLKTLNHKKTLIWDTKNVQKKSIFKFSKEYMKFLNDSKTVRESVKSIVDCAKKNGFVDIKTFKSEPEKKEKQKKFFRVYKNKMVALCYLGKQTTGGFNMIGSHIDAPRLDLKPSPLYEDSGFGMMKTHYYGGVRKYQWFSIPLAMHGTVCLKTGKSVNIVIGEKEDEPCFVIADLLPHLAKNERKKLVGTMDPEKMNVVVGSIPITSKKITNRVKTQVLFHLNQQYGLKEEDFLCSEIEFVPANKSRHIGLDMSMIGSYGQDDRSCSYCSLIALMNLKEQPEKTAMSFFYDREEIGSCGNLGAKSQVLEDFVSDMLDQLIGDNKNTSKVMRKIFIDSNFISADVTAGLNPNFKGVHDMKNVAKLGCGVVMMKYGGARGKVSTHESSCEFMNKLRICFEKNKVVWQSGLLGKIEHGGGGTIAKFIAQRGCNVLDLGVPLIGMHSPFEISSKADVYHTMLAYNAFFKME